MTLFSQHYPPFSSAFYALVDSQVQLALAEDVGTGDLTAALVPAEQHVTASIIAREPAIICGQDWVNACFLQTDANIHIMVNYRRRACSTQASVVQNNRASPRTVNR